MNNRVPFAVKGNILFLNFLISLEQGKKLTIFSSVVNFSCPNDGQTITFKMTPKGFKNCS